MIRKLAIAVVVLLGLAALAVFGLRTDVRPTVKAVLPERGFSHARLARVLDRFVDEQGRVDYAGLGADRGDLEAYLALLAQASPSISPERFDSVAAKLAYYINAYNAFVLYGVTERPELVSVYEARLDFFVLTRYPVGSAQLSLYELENDVVRPLGEPRAHFALNCASLGCPQLPRTPFTAEQLEVQLARETRAFCADPDNIRLNGDTVEVSQIFEWYSEDFEADGGPVAFCRKWGREDLPADAPLDFIPYDWAMNRGEPNPIR